MNNKFLKSLSVLLFSAFTLSACATAPKGAMAKIGKEYITEEQVNAEYNKLSTGFTDEQKKTYDESTEEGKKNIISLKQNILDATVANNVIKEKLSKIAESYKKDGKSEEEISKVTVKDEEVDKQIENIKTQVGGEDKFKEELEKYKITQDDLKKQLKDKMYSQKFQIWFSENYKPSDDEVKAKYIGSEFEGPEISASHILVENEEDAKKAKERIDKGEDFEKVAKEVSKDPSAATNNGVLGTFTKGVMVAEFYDAATKLEIGQVSEPVKSKFGYHIIKLTGKTENFEDFSDSGKTTIQNKIQQQILSAKYKEEFEKIKKEVGYLPIKNFKEK